MGPLGPPIGFLPYEIPKSLAGRRAAGSTSIRRGGPGYGAPTPGATVLSGEPDGLV